MPKKLEETKEIKDKKIQLKLKVQKLQQQKKLQIKKRP